MRGEKFRMFERPPCIGKSTHESFRFTWKRAVFSQRLPGTELSEAATTHVLSFDSFVVVTELRPLGAPAGLKLSSKLPRNEAFCARETFQSTFKVPLLLVGLNCRITLASVSARFGIATWRTRSSVGCTMF